MRSRGSTGIDMISSSLSLVTNDVSTNRILTDSLNLMYIQSKQVTIIILSNVVYSHFAFHAKFLKIIIDFL